MSNPGNLSSMLQDLMVKAKTYVDEIDPVISFVHRKIDKYQKEREFDIVTLVGSVGNQLYFPEKLPDGSFLIELDVLYSRKIPDISLPVMDDYEKIPVAQIVPVVKKVTHFPDHAEHEIDNSTGGRNVDLKTAYTCFLEVFSVNCDLTDNDSHDLLERSENGKSYLNSSAYKGSIPQKFEPSILGEREIETFGSPLLLPLYRTFKTDIISLSDGDKVLKFQLLIDKVAAVKAPWPDIAAEFQTRDRKWPSSDTVEEVINNGCLFVHNPHSCEIYNAEWKITFSLAEQTIALKFTFHQRFLFIILKLIKRKHLDLGTFENGDSRSGLTTYHMKTIFMWLSENIEVNEWSSRPDVCLIMFFEKLKNCIESEYCPHYFIPEVNIMSDIWQYKRLTEDEYDKFVENTPIKTVLLQKIEEIRQKTSEVLNEALFDPIDEKHVFELQKPATSFDPVLEVFDHILHEEEGLNIDFKFFHDEKPM